MDKLTIYEALSLIRVNEQALATQFQVLLTITFATIVAVFAGREILKGVIKWLVTMLYLLASVAITGTSVYFAESHAQLSYELIERGANVPAPAFAGLIYFVVYLTGIATTVYFIHMNKKHLSD